MERDLGAISVISLSVTGALAVLIGLWLPWLVVKPDHTGVVPAIHLPGMEHGFAGLDLPIVVVVVVGVALSTVYGSERTRARLALATAALTLLLAVWHVGQTAGIDGTYLDVFVVGGGVPLTLFGGGVLLVAGVLRYVIVGADDRRPRSESSLD